MYTENECDQGHVTVKTVPWKLQQWDRYPPPRNILLFIVKLQLLSMSDIEWLRVKPAYH